MANIYVAWGIGLQCEGRWSRSISWQAIVFPFTHGSAQVRSPRFKTFFAMKSGCTPLKNCFIALFGNKGYNCRGLWPQDRHTHRVSAARPDCSDTKGNPPGERPLGRNTREHRFRRVGTKAISAWPPALPASADPRPLSRRLPLLQPLSPPVPE
jgi:hypothetical protein